MKCSLLYSLLLSLATLLYANSSGCLGIATFEKAAGQTPSPVVFSDERTLHIIEGLTKLGVPCELSENVSKSSKKQIACFMTQDGKGSFYSYAEGDVDLEYNARQFANVRLVHIDGNLISDSFCVEKTMHLAKEARAIVSFDLTNPGIVEKFRERLLGALTAYTDIVFVNEATAWALTHLPPKQACSFLKNFSKIVVVKSDEEGYWICSEERLFHCPRAATTTSPKEDALFVSGFLYGYLRQYPLEICARLGASTK